MEKLGPYKIDKLLGRGGMGSVYLAEHAETGERAAVKTLSPSMAADEGFRDRFVSEIDSLKKLQHPNIIRLFGWGEEQGQLFYAMEYIDGSNLQEELTKGRRFDWQQVMKIALDICRGLKHAHDSGVIHRDLKPANLLIDQEGTIKLLDFGIAKLFGASQLTVEGGVMGTADFMAPEQAHGQPVTPRCDFYSLGSVMYTLLAGRPPFAARTMPEVLHKLCYEEPKQVTHYASDTPKPLAELVHDLLEKEPDKRVPTAMALLKRIEALQHGLARRSEREQQADEETDFDVRPPGGDFDPAVHSAQTKFAVDDDSGRVTRVLKKDVDRGQDTGTLDTIVRPTQPDSTPPPAEGAAAGAAPREPQTHFTTVEEAPQEKTPWSDQQRTPVAVIVGLAVALLLLVGTVVFMATRSPSADSLYETISAAADRGDFDSLSNVEDEIKQFAEKFPDDERAAEVAILAEELELGRLARKYERAARRPSMTARLTPVERAYLEAIEAGRTRPEAAVTHLQAIVDVYGSAEESSEETALVVLLARRQIKRLQSAVDKSGEDHLDELESTLAHANRIHSSDPDQAAAIYRGVVTLYEDRGWAGPVVQRAKQALAELEM